MKKLLIPFVIVLLALNSCKKNNAVIDNGGPGSTSDPYKDEFVPCNCSEQNGHGDGTGEYIKAEVNGIPICADVAGQFSNSFGNMLKYGNIIRSTGSTYYDNLYMIRYTKDNRFMMGIFMENSHALTKQFPYELPRPNLEYCEIGELQLQNQAKITSDMCYFCTTNDWHYWSSFFTNGLTLYADKFENGIFEGRFSGTIRTGSGRIAIIKNGSYRIKLTQIQEDLIVP